MQGVHGTQESETASVIKVFREPAIIINGVPDLTTDSMALAQVEIRNNLEAKADPCFGDWLEGRKVRKSFGGQYYFGKVVKYDSENNWYTILYEDGDQEDVDWHELEEILLPLDITIPLKTLAMEKCKLEKTVCESRPKVSRPRKICARIEGITENTPQLLPVSKSSDVMCNELAVLPVEKKARESRPRGRPRKVHGKSETTEKTPLLLAAPKSSDVLSNQLAVLRTKETTQESLKGNNQPRKRGRPRKVVSTSSNPQSAASMLGSSLALVPASAANTMENASDPMRNQLVVLQMEKTQESRPEIGRPGKIYANGEGGTVKTPEKSIDGMSNQLQVQKMEEKTQESLNGSNQPRKRGRPRKVRTTSDNPQGAEKVPSSSLALLPAPAANTVENASTTNDAIAQEALRRRNEILPGNMHKMEEKTQESLNGGNQPRKRGRPRKVRTISDSPPGAKKVPSSSLALLAAPAASTVENASTTNDAIAQEALRRRNGILPGNMHKKEEKTQESLNGSNQPRKRGRPRKVRTTSDNPQGAEKIPSSSLALLPAPAANTVENASTTNDAIAQEALRRRNEILPCNMPKMEEKPQDSLKGNNQPKKRGRPRKSVVPQSAESIPISSVEPVPPPAANTLGNTSTTNDVMLQEALGRRNEIPEHNVLKKEETTQQSLKGKNQPRKRGRPRKSANPQSAASIPISSTALMPAPAANSVEKGSTANDAPAHEGLKRQTDILWRNMQTARAEKQKRREKFRVQGASPGTQLF